MAFFQDMYLKIESDIIVEALDNKDNTALGVLRQVASAIINGKHVIIISTADVQKLKKNKDFFSKPELAAFDKVGRFYIQSSSLTQNMDVKAYVTFSKHTMKEGNKIYINPREITQFEFLEETHLLTENLDDAKLFKYLIQYYQRKDKIRGCVTCSYNLMGGGNTMCEVVKYEKDLKQHFLFSVADSDYHYLGDCHLGDTAQKTINSLNDNPFNCGFYAMQKVCEVENLIPLKYIYSNTNFKAHPVLRIYDKFDMSFFDMKDGLRYKYLSNDDAFNYWETSLSEYVAPKEFKKINNIRKKYTQEEFEKKYGNNVVLEGFGTHLLNQSLKIMSDAKEIVNNDDLTESQKYEWYKIGKFLFNWCCSYPKMVG